jgi:hypothetical protein
MKLNHYRDNQASLALAAAIGAVTWRKPRFGAIRYQVLDLLTGQARPAKPDEEFVINIGIGQGRYVLLGERFGLVYPK